MAGRTDFREEVRSKLEHSGITYLQGYVESFRKDVTHDLFWLDSVRNLRKFKEAIGSKLIWKHRIRFYTSLEVFLSSQKNTETLQAKSQEKVRRGDPVL